MVDTVLALPETRLMILAPVVAGRKGEQLDLIGDLRAQGFVRIRIDGEIHEIDTLPKLDKNVRHTSTWSSTGSRPARIAPAARRSFETALAHAGRSRPSRWRWIAATSTCSRHVSPVRCAALRSPRLEPRLFSFNNPAGACPKCDGLGIVDFFDPARVVLTRPVARLWVPSAAGIVATSSTSRCWRAWPSTTN